MKKNFWRNALILLLCLVLSGCTAGTPAAAEPTAAPTAEPTAAPTAEPTAEPTAAPTAEPEETSGGTGPSGGVTEHHFEAMKPLFTAHILAQLNGMTYDQNSPEYFWQTVVFAIDGCGMDFYSAETFGSALTLSRGVIEEIVSALFEGGGNVLLETPESLHGEIRYDAEADAFSHPLGESVFTVKAESLTQNEDGSVTFTGSLHYAEEETPVTRFTAVLVQNTREGNSLFTYSVRSLQLCG